MNLEESIFYLGYDLIWGSYYLLPHRRLSGTEFEFTVTISIGKLKDAVFFYHFP